MNIALWIIQIILSIKLMSVSYTHGLRQSKPTMQDAIHKLGKISKPILTFVAIITFLGAVGLILPGILGLPNGIIVITAGILCVFLLVSLFFHLKSREKPRIFVSIVLFALAAFVAYGRWVFIP